MCVCVCLGMTGVLDDVKVFPIDLDEKRVAVSIICVIGHVYGAKRRSFGDEIIWWLNKLSHKSIHKIMNIKAWFLINVNID